MAEYGPATGARLLCGLGGSLDVFAGTVERAPEFWREARLRVVLPALQGAEAYWPYDEAAAVFGTCESGKEAKMSGKLIVFEGTDGSGKATQTKLLCRYLSSMVSPIARWISAVRTALCRHGAGVSGRKSWQTPWRRECLCCIVVLCGRPLHPIGKTGESFTRAAD